MLARGTKTRRASGSDDATGARVSFMNVIVASVRVSAPAYGQGLLARSAILNSSTFIFSIIKSITGARPSLGKVLEIGRPVEVTCHAPRTKCGEDMDILTTLIFHS